jgi:hypothetical protein
MSNTNTGGPAFPYPFYDEKGHCIDGIEGMTLRDYFAAKAMQGLLELAPQDKQQWTNDLAAETAYAMADAMLKAREA